MNLHWHIYTQYMYKYNSYSTWINKNIFLPSQNHQRPKHLTCYCSSAMMALEAFPTTWHETQFLCNRYSKQNPKTIKRIEFSYLWRYINQKPQQKRTYSLGDKKKNDYKPVQSRSRKKYSLKVPGKACYHRGWRILYPHTICIQHDPLNYTMNILQVLVAAVNKKQDKKIIKSKRRSSHI